MNDLSLTRIALELLQINENFYQYLEDPYKSSIRDFELETFEQTWSNTSGGFEGVGGCMCTTQRTYVFIPKTTREKCLVFFGSRFGYRADYSREFLKDVEDKSVVGVRSKDKYNKKES